MDGPSDPLEDKAATPSKVPRKRFTGRRRNADSGAVNSTSNGNSDDANLGLSKAANAGRRVPVLNQIPQEILADPALQAALATLPSNYNFEIPKTIHRIRTLGARNIALQFPEGLLLFAPLISDILTSFCPGTDTLIMGDVTYGACCIDDFTARALGCDLLVHYGHSCLVPLDQTGGIKTLYIFVTINVDLEHLVQSVEKNFQPGKKIALVGTIQFNAALHAMVPRLRKLGFDILLPRSSPLSAGEILGCTAPTLALKNSPQEGADSATPTADMILYVGDGRFHLESIMIASPSLRASAYRYDPYSRRLTHETYEHAEMHSLRGHAIKTAKSAISKSSKTLQPQNLEQPKAWGIILGTLGRQGNPHTLALISAHLTSLEIPYVTLLLSEIQPMKLSLLSRDMAVWVQIACPRLSIDWGYAFERPLLSPYEAMVALGITQAGGWLRSDDSNEARLENDGVPSDGHQAVQIGHDADHVYPMNFYSHDGLGRVKAKDVPSVSTAS